MVVAHPHPHLLSAHVVHLGVVLTGVAIEQRQRIAGLQAQDLNMARRPRGQQHHVPRGQCQVAIQARHGVFRWGCISLAP